LNRRSRDGASRGNVVAWDASYRTASSGNVLWSVKLRYCSAVAWQAWPTVVAGTVYLGTCDGQVVAISPATGSATPTVKTIASFPGGAIRGALASDGARLYAQVEYSPNTTRQIHAVAVDPAAAKPVVWDRTLPNPQGQSIEVIVANGTVYAADASEVAYINSADGGWKGQATSIGVYPTTPAVANGVLYTGGLGFGGGNVGALQAFDATTGLTLYYSSINGRVANTSPAVANGMVYLGAGNATGLLYGYHLAAG
jgi:outer membrane protein assembly factor BamB